MKRQRMTTSRKKSKMNSRRDKYTCTAKSKMVEARIKEARRKEHEERLRRLDEAETSYGEYKRMFPGYSELFLGRVEERG